MLRKSLCREKLIRQKLIPTRMTDSVAETNRHTTHLLFSYFPFIEPGAAYGALIDELWEQRESNINENTGKKHTWKCATTACRNVRRKRNIVRSNGMSFECRHARPGYIDTSSLYRKYSTQAYLYRALKSD